MSDDSAGTARRPRDVHARERLRAAQRQEAQAVARVVTAQDGLGRAIAKRDSIVATADQSVQRAQRALAIAQRALVETSGLDRAAVVLGIGRGQLRKFINAAAAVDTAREPHADAAPASEGPTA